MHKIIVFSLFVLLLLYLSRKENIPKCSAHFACKDILSELLSWMFKTTLYTRLMFQKQIFCDFFWTKIVLWKYLLFDVRLLLFWNHGMVHACLHISCLCIYCFSHYTFFIFLISILIVIQPSVHWHSVLLVWQAQMKSPPYKAKELWIMCELPHMHLLLPEMKFLIMKAGWRDAPLALQDLAEAIS